MSNMKHVKQFKSWNAFDKAKEKDGIPYTARVGHIEASPAELVRLFGKPCESDGYKVSGEYLFKIWDRYITLYDWKQTSLYDDSQPSPKDFWKNEERVILNVGSQHLEHDSGYTIYLLLDLIRTRRAELKQAELDNAITKLKQVKAKPAKQDKAEQAELSNVIAMR